MKLQNLVAKNLTRNQMRKITGGAVKVSYYCSCLSEGGAAGGTITGSYFGSEIDLNRCPAGTASQICTILNMGPNAS
jgi:hypothetical protein